MLDRDVRPRLHAYLATICGDVGAELVHAGGVADHVHIVMTLPRTVSQALDSRFRRLIVFENIFSWGVASGLV